ncbi:MAG: hypothetical protein K6F00_07255 [Lachnospiraceae bacterium]|nr:hypothetical protein [Lachnospiraceae bacterium]
MDLYTCKKCKKLTKSLVRGICSDCYNEIESKYTDVKYYIYDHPDAKLADVAKEYDIPAAYIENWIREGRIVIKSESEGFAVHCQKCGKPITSGKLCGACISKLGHQLRDLDAAGKEKSTHASFRDTKY